MRTGVLLYAKLNQTIMTGYKVRLFSSHRKDKTIEAKGEYFYYRYFICSRSLVEQDLRCKLLVTAVHYSLPRRGSSTCNQLEEI